MWLGSSVATTPGSMSVDSDVGQQLLAQRLRPAVEAPLGGGIDAVAGPGGAAGNGGDVDDVATAVGGAGLELVEEDLGGGDGAEEVDLDHLPVVGALVGGERAEEHDAGVVDQDVGAAELVLDAPRRGDEAVAVGDVGGDGDGVVAELLRDCGEAVGSPRQERDAVAVGGQRAGGGRPDSGRGTGDDGDQSAVVGVVHELGLLLQVGRVAGGQASGMSRPNASRVMASGSGPPRWPVSRASIAASSSAVRSKSKTSKFSAIRAGLVDFGIDRAALLQVPAQHHLGGVLPCVVGDGADDRVLQGAGVLPSR